MRHFVAAQILYLGTRQHLQRRRDFEEKFSKFEENFEIFVLPKKNMKKNEMQSLILENKFPYKSDYDDYLLKDLFGREKDY